MGSCINPCCNYRDNSVYIGTGTVRYPAREIMERARRWENREDFLFKDIYDVESGVERVMQAIAAGQEDFGSEWRQKDLDYLMSNEFRAHLEKYDVIPITWREVYESYVSQKMS